MLAAALTVAFLPLGAANVWAADNSQVLAISDDDKVEQENEAKVKQKAENNAAAVSGDNSINVPVAASDQDATVTQVNSNTDDDTFVQTAVIDDRDACGILAALNVIVC